MESEKIHFAPVGAKTLLTTASSVNTALSTGIKAVSIYSRGSDAKFKIGNGAQDASNVPNFIASGERQIFDVSVYATPNIAVIFGPTGAASNLEITELA